MSNDNPYNAVLVDRRDIHDALAVFTIRYDSDAAPDFVPGQYTTLGLIDPDAPPPNPNSPRSRRKGPRLIRRAYSIASAPNNNPQLEFYVVRIDDGRFTQLLWGLGPGDPLFMDENIKGTFTLDGIPEGKDMVMVATGTGLGPYMSMLKTYKNTGRWRRLVMIEGCRRVNDLGYHEELTKLAAGDASLVYLPTVTREPDNSTWQGRRGRVHDILKPDRFLAHTGFALDPAQCHVMLCGRPEMIEQAADELEALGFATRDRNNPDGNIHYERYW